MAYRVFYRTWPSKAKQALWWMMLPELAMTVALLVLFAIAQPDLYRTRLWKAGDDLGFNSSPNIVLYAYANYQPLPTIPFVWSSTLTNFNVAISVISLFMLITKLIAVIMNIWYPLLAFLFNIPLTVLYTTSVYGQMGPDYASPAHPSPIAWYIAKPCTVAASTSVQKSCVLAKGTYAATVLMLVVTLTNLILNVWAMLPNEKDRRSVDYDSDDEEYSSTLKKNDKSWEMHGIPQTPRTTTVPYTPRTMAFNTLERKLPLRSQYH